MQVLGHTSHCVFALPSWGVQRMGWTKTSSKEAAYLFIHSLTHSVTDSLIHSIIHSCIHLFIHSFTHPLTHSFLHSLTYSFTTTFILSFIQSSVRAVARTQGSLETRNHLEAARDQGPISVQCCTTAGHTAHPAELTPVAVQPHVWGITSKLTRCLTQEAQAFQMQWNRAECPMFSLFRTRRHSDASLEAFAGPKWWMPWAPHTCMGPHCPVNGIKAIQRWSWSSSLEMI